MTPEQFTETLRLTEQEGLGRRRVAEALGLTYGCVIGKLWRYYNPQKARASRIERYVYVRRGRRIKSPSTWTERALTETWAERKVRLANELHHV